MQKASFTFECSFLGSGQLYLEFDNVMGYLTEGSQLFPRNSSAIILFSEKAWFPQIITKSVVLV